MHWPSTLHGVNTLRQKFRLTIPLKTMQCTIEPASDKKFIKIRNCSLYNYIIAFSDTLWYPTSLWSVPRPRLIPASNEQIEEASFLWDGFLFGGICHCLNLSQIVKWTFKQHTIVLLYYEVVSRGVIHKYLLHNYLCFSTLTHFFVWIILFVF